MKRLLLGLCLASLTMVTAGCCCWQGSGWTPCPWPGCGWGQGCGWNGGGPGCGCDDGCGGGGWGGWAGWGCNRPGGCGEMYWGDWCTGDPHCSTCDNGGNWVGPPSPGGNGLPPGTYSRAHPYGNQVVNGAAPRRSPQMQQQMARRSPPPEYSRQMVTRGNPNQYPGRRPAPQMADRGPRQEYEGAVEYLGTTDRIVKPATVAKNRSSSPASVARRGEPTLADPDQEFDAPPQVRRTSQRQYTR